jgi:hypothetical protein
VRSSRRAMGASRARSEQGEKGRPSAVSRGEHRRAAGHDHGWSRVGAGGSSAGTGQRVAARARSKEEDAVEGMSSGRGWSRAHAQEKKWSAMAPLDWKQTRERKRSGCALEERSSDRATRNRDAVARKSRGQSELAAMAGAPNPAQRKTGQGQGRRRLESEQGLGRDASSEASGRACLNFMLELSGGWISAQGKENPEPRTEKG